MGRFGDFIGSKPFSMYNNHCQMSACKGLLSSGAFVPLRDFYVITPRSLHPSVRRCLRVRATTSSTEQNPSSSSSSSSKQRNRLSAVIDLPRAIWRQTLRPLNNFGFGKKSIWEGGVGLFVLSGAVLLAFSIAWLKGFWISSRFRKYRAVLEFSQACGISIGTPVRIRGVTVGSVVEVRPSLERIGAVIEVADEKVVIPLNSLVQVNQSGLLMETLIDITPRPPVPTPSVGPLEPDCSKEGLIVCDRQTIKGEQGVSLDELVGIFTRLGRQMDDISITKTYNLAERIGFAIEEAKPLLAKIEAMAEDVQPLLREVREGGLLKEIEHLTKGLADASVDLRKLNSSILTPENTELLRQSVSTLIVTLRNIESISGDISGFTGDTATRHNLKQLIEYLRRLVAD